MAIEEFPVPETKVLAIASHVVYGYVGNKMATFVLQALGCDVSALNTVHFSNHTGYKQVEGMKFPADHIRDLWRGLQKSYLIDYDALLSGYAPSREAVEAVGSIARDLRYHATGKPGSFFWALDPVMGDQGRLYVSEDVVPAYKNIMREADLILPNQFEAESVPSVPLISSAFSPIADSAFRSLSLSRTLSGITISSMSSLKACISHLHQTYSIPHIIITSFHLPRNTESDSSKSHHPHQTLTVIGSSSTSTHQPRLFKITVPYLPCFFSGTGDLFAALALVRLREASSAAGLLSTKSWSPPDDFSTSPVELPLAKAIEKVLASMHSILEKTLKARAEELSKPSGTVRNDEYGGGVDSTLEGDGDNDDGHKKRKHLAETKAAEIRVVRNVKELWDPPNLEKFKAEIFDKE